MQYDYEKERIKRIIKLQKEYRRNAKLANSRLAALEKRGGGILRFAYAGAVHDTQALFGKNRFSYEISAMKPEDVDLRQLSMFNTIAKNFLEDNTSTYKGFVETAQKRVNTIYERYGIRLTPEEAQQIFEDEYFRKLADSFGSETAMKMIASIKKSKDELAKEIPKAQKQHRAYGDMVVEIASDGTPLTAQDISPKEKRILMKIAKFIIKDAVHTVP